MYIKDIINLQLQSISRQLQLIDKQLDEYADLEPGTLICRSHGITSSYYYLQHFKNGKRDIKYLGKTDNQTVGQYKAQRFYNEKKSALLANQEALKKVTNKLIDSSFEAIYEKLPPSYRNLPPNCYVDGQCNILQNWAKEEYEHNPFPLPIKPNIACDGTPTRSKGETIIYDDLTHQQIPFHYDPKISVLGNSGIFHNLYPDFLFKCIDESEILWEHLGMIDKEKYSERLVNKISEYMDCGFVIGDNLIISSDNMLITNDTVSSSTNEVAIMDLIELVKHKIYQGNVSTSN